MKKKLSCEIMSARSRLKGILQDLVVPNNLEIDEDNENKSNVPIRGRPPKTKRAKITGTERCAPVRESFVMKLFDRSLDLANYSEASALYPICRAWITNTNWTENKNIRSPEIIENNYEYYEKIINGEIKEVTSMPQPACSEISSIPERVPKKIDETDDFPINTSVFSTDDILQENKLYWKTIRNEWISHVRKYQNKYEMNFNLLDAIKET